MKLFMEALHILYVDVEDELIMYIIRSLICKVMPGTLMLY
jgi:hypothetical protein